MFRQDMQAVYMLSENWLIGYIDSLFDKSMNQVMNNKIKKIWVLMIQVCFIIWIFNCTLNYIVISTTYNFYRIVISMLKLAS